MYRRPQISKRTDPLFPYPTLFRSGPRRVWKHGVLDALVRREGDEIAVADPDHQPQREDAVEEPLARRRVPCGEDGIELERLAAHDERRGEEVVRLGQRASERVAM